jgi:NDP-sugar pyrophosphorylase family protein
MNTITKKSVKDYGYHFISGDQLPKGKDEYYLRFSQNTRKDYKKLTAKQMAVLQANGNVSGNWTDVWVAPGCDVSLIKNCRFYGLVRIGKLEPLIVGFSDLEIPVGLYNSTIISSDIGDNVAIDQVLYLSHYIIGNDVILTNISELITSNRSKFGNGVIKKGEKEAVRIWLELCNENGGRSIMPFEGMLPGDAWLWTRYRDDAALMDKFKSFTEQDHGSERGYYGTIGDRTVIKNTAIVKDVKIGTDAYIKGANKLKNLTINSAPNAKSQIGEGCEMVNGIIGYGCRSFYGVKAVRFIMGSFSQLKYGARLINSYLGDNSTISCCEVLNSLIFPAHEQHHNNSFLCAATLMGQTNMAAGATIGSNHNSRGADGELIAGRGFWPGLCVSLKHNSKFAAFTLLAKGDFPAELQIPLPFSLVSNDVTHNKLVIMPAYWFMYNMYALARNEGKYLSRDRRVVKVQHLEYDFLAPDTVHEIVQAITLLEKFTGKAFYAKKNKKATEQDWIEQGHKLLQKKPETVKELTVLADGFENSNRPVEIIKVAEAYDIFKQLIVYNAVAAIKQVVKTGRATTHKQLIKMMLAKKTEENWINLGGQLLPEAVVKGWVKDIKTGTINSWSDLHQAYTTQKQVYGVQKTQQAFTALVNLFQADVTTLTPAFINGLLEQAMLTRRWMVEKIYTSRAKDYQSPFRKMVYETEQEMEKVIGKLSDNSFINEQKGVQELFEQEIEELRSHILKAKA